MLPKEIKGLILDMDGVLWRGDEPIEGLIPAFEKIKSRNLDCRLLTNNSTGTPEQYAKKLTKFGLQIDKKYILTSAQAVAHLLAIRFPNGGPVYVIGEIGLQTALNDAGFFTGDQPLAVVAGMDRKLTYSKLEKATRLIRAGIPFLERILTRLSPPRRV